MGQVQLKDKNLIEIYNNVYFIYKDKKEILKIDNKEYLLYKISYTNDILMYDFYDKIRVLFRKSIWDNKNIEIIIQLKDKRLENIISKEDIKKIGAPHFDFLIDYFNE